MAIICKHCNMSNKDDASYCVNCGKPFGKEKTVVDKFGYETIKKENKELETIAYSRKWEASRYGFLSGRFVRSKSYKELLDEEVKHRQMIQWITYPTIALLVLGGLILFFNMKSDLDYYKFSNSNNLSEANKWYSIAAKNGVANSSEVLSVWGDSILTDEYDKYKRAAKEGNMFALYTIGKYQEDSINREIKGDHMSWYKVAADKGYAAAQLKMAYNAETDSEKVFWFEQAANLGNAEAQNNLGNIFYSGRGVKRDMKEAFGWFKRSGELGYVWGQLNLGAMYRYGHGTPKDTTLAVMWLKKAAEQNNPNAMNELGELSKSVKDYSNAMSWFKKAADRKYARACQNIANLYYYGHGVSTNYQKMMEWYKKGAEYGDGESQYQLGIIYKEGKYGQTIDLEKSLYWFKKVSDYNYKWATYNIGEIYEYGGNGINKDIQEALTWYKRSADAGYYKAKERLKKFEKES